MAAMPPLGGDSSTEEERELYPVAPVSAEEFSFEGSRIFPWPSDAVVRRAITEYRLANRSAKTHMILFWYFKRPALGEAVRRVLRAEEIADRRVRADAAWLDIRPAPISDAGRMPRSPPLLFPDTVPVTASRAPPFLRAPFAIAPRPLPIEDIGTTANDEPEAKRLRRTSDFDSSLALPSSSSSAASNWYND